MRRSSTSASARGGRRVSSVRACRGPMQSGGPVRARAPRLDGDQFPLLPSSDAGAGCGAVSRTMAAGRRGFTGDIGVLITRFGQ